MSEGLNQWTGIGALGADPELRFSQSQQGILSFRMACTERYLDSNTKEWKERTEWLTIVTFGKRAEALNKLISKGSKVGVTGRVQTRSWEDKQGNKRYTTEIIANNILLLGSKGAAGGSGDYNNNTESPPDEPDMDSIPF